MGVQMNKEFIESVGQFMRSAGQTTEGFNVRQAALYTGLQFEELAEKLEALGLAGYAARLGAMGDLFKTGKFDRDIELADPLELLDADIDLAVVSIGSAYSMGADVLGAAGEVCRANLDKAGPDGKIARDANGKAMKPEGWVAPDLVPFLGKGDV